MSDARRVCVVTDSTCDLPKAIVEEHDLVIVPLYVSFGEETFRDRIDLTPEQFLDRLTGSERLPTTSQPTIADFESVFREALDRDQDVVCVTISSELSGTFNSARLAAEEVDPSRIAIVDGRGASVQTGWIAVAAARAAMAGGDRDAVAAAAADAAASRVKMYALLQSLDYAHKGGRIGKAQHLVGSALAIKPILGVVDGVVIPVERIRTWKKAVARLPELITPAPTDIAVLHSRNLPDAQILHDRLQEMYPEARLHLAYAGAVIMTYAGPGSLEVAALYPE